MCLEAAESVRAVTPLVAAEKKGSVWRLNGNDFGVKDKISDQFCFSKTRGFCCLQYFYSQDMLQRRVGQNNETRLKRIADLQRPPTVSFSLPELSASPAPAENAASNKRENSDAQLSEGNVTLLTTSRYQFSFA